MNSYSIPTSAKYNSTANFKLYLPQSQYFYQLSNNKKFLFYSKNISWFIWRTFVMKHLFNDIITYNQISTFVSNSSPLIPFINLPLYLVLVFRQLIAVVVKALKLHQYAYDHCSDILDDIILIHAGQYGDFIIVKTPLRQAISKP